MPKKLISIIIPSYNEENNIKPLYKEIIKNLKKINDNYEIIFINDGSTDETLNQIKSLTKTQKKVHYISFSRNFGHQSALKAGIDHARGHCAISLDADLQHPPGMIPEMIQKWKQGYEIVYTIRDDKKNTAFLKRITSKLFYKIMRFLSGIQIEEGAADFRLIDQKVVSYIKKHKEKNLFLRGLISWVGFQKYGILYTPQNRLTGKSKYTLRKMLSFAVTGITSFSIKPLRLALFLGFFTTAISFFYLCYVLWVYLFTDNAIRGWASQISITLFFHGLQFIILGIIGEYIGKTFMESKNKTNYIIQDSSL